MSNKQSMRFSKLSCHLTHCAIYVANTWALYHSCNAAPPAALPWVMGLDNTGQSSPYLHMASSKQVFHKGAVGTAHSSMVNGKAMRQNGLQVEVVAGLCLSLQVQTTTLGKER